VSGGKAGGARTAFNLRKAQHTPSRAPARGSKGGLKVCVECQDCELLSRSVNHGDVAART
jgi:hypothetical protein